MMHTRHLRHVRSPRDLLSPLDRRTRWFSYFPIRKFASTVHFARPLFFFISRNQLHKFSVDHSALESTRSEVSVNADFLSPLLGLWLYRVFATRDTNRSVFQPLIHKMSSCQNSRSLYLTTSLLARSINSYVISRCPRH